MDSAIFTVTLEEFKLFQGIDRELYTILVRDLQRNPSECLQIMGLWLWLERGGFRNVISKILSQPPFSINELADEAVACLMYIDGGRFPFQVEAVEISLTQSIVEKDISLQFFHDNRLTAYHEIRTLVSEVYIPALSDIMERARHGGFGEISTHSHTTMQGHAASISSAVQIRARSSFDDSLVQGFSSISIGGDGSPSQSRARANETALYERTMFATFSKGYPVSESEVREFFTRVFGNCIESIHMQEVSYNEQALYARVVFLSPSFIQVILDGMNKAKFTINGKHVWMRKFLSNNGRLLPCGCPISEAWTCPH